MLTFNGKISLAINLIALVITSVVGWENFQLGGFNYKV